MNEPRTDKRISLADIAAAAGVSRMTVSCALRNQPGVSMKQRTRIQDIARSLGYVPDAQVGQWMAKVRGAKTRNLLPIAWLNTDHQFRDCWNEFSYLRPYLLGAQEQCARNGYRLEPFWCHERGMSPRRISQILYQRGINGVILAPPDRVHIGRIQLDWSHFSVGTFENGIGMPQVSCVSQDYYYNMQTTLGHLEEMGFRKIGVFVSEQTDKRALNAQQAAIGFFQSHGAKANWVSSYLHVEYDNPGEGFEAWLDKEKPEVIVCQNSHLLSWLRDLGRRVPEDISLVHTAVEDDCLDWAGIWARKREIGAAAADLVISLMRNQETGVPEVPRYVYLRGRWHDGVTLKKIR